MDDEDWIIRKSGAYYRPNCSGYTLNVTEAGRYTEKFAKDEASLEPHRMSAHHISEFPALTIQHEEGTPNKFVNDALQFAVLTLAFLGRDRGTDRLDNTLDGLCDLARKIDRDARALLAATPSLNGH